MTQFQLQFVNVTCGKGESIFLWTTRVRFAALPCSACVKSVNKADKGATQSLKNQ